MRRSAAVILAIVLISAAIGGAIIWREAPKWIEGAAIDAAASSGIALKFENPSAFLLGFSADSAAVRPKRFPLGLELRTPSLSIAPGSLLSLAPEAVFTASLLEGSLRVDGALRNIRSNKIKGSAQAKNINIAAHPQLQALGFVSGLLNADLSNAALDERGIVSGSFSFSLVDAEKPEETSLPLPTPEGIMTVTIPAITNIRIEGEGSLSLQGLTLGSLELKSSLIAAKGDLALIKGDPPYESSLRGNFDVSLSQLGQKELGIYFAMLSGGSALSTPQRFLVSVSGPMNKPQFRVRAIEN